MVVGYAYTSSDEPSEELPEALSPAKSLRLRTVSASVHSKQALCMHCCASIVSAAP